MVVKCHSERYCLLRCDFVLFDRYVLTSQRNVLSPLQSGSVGVFSTLKRAARFCEMLISMFRNVQPDIVEDCAVHY